jgi:2-oxoglutarate ferredoxin oxidoreductase subunit gamma
VISSIRSGQSGRGERMRKEIRFAGFGGQGIMLAVHIVGHASSIFDRKNAVLTQSYGPEARGGASSADVVISDSEIDYPKVTIPDILVIMSQEAYTTYGQKMAKDAILIIDEDLVKITDGRKFITVPATRLAEQLGKRIVANIVMLGFFAKQAESIVTYDAIKKSLLVNVPKGTEELNLKAFNAGYDYVKK